MSEQKVTDLQELNATPATGDTFHIVDVSDQTDDAAGTSKKITWENLVKNYVDGLISTLTSTVSSLSSSLTTHTGATDTHGATGAVVGTTNTQTLTNKTLTNPVLTTPTINSSGVFQQITTPANPASGFNKIYAKSDDKFYTLDSAGNEVEVGAGGGGAGGKYEIIIPGTVSAGTGLGTWHAPTGITSVDTVQIIADTAGATGSTVADINKNSTSIFPSATKPTLADTATSNTATPDTTAATGGDIYTVDLDSITTTPQTTIRIVFYYS